MNRLSRFKDVATDRLPRSQSGRLGHIEEGGAVDVDFIRAVVDRWREATTTNSGPRIGLSALGGSDEVGAMESMAASLGSAGRDEGLGAPLIPRKVV